MAGRGGLQGGDGGAMIGVLDGGDAEGHGGAMEVKCRHGSS